MKQVLMLTAAFYLFFSVAAKHSSKNCDYLDGCSCDSKNGPYTEPKNVKCSCGQICNYFISSYDVKNTNAQLIQTRYYTSWPECKDDKDLQEKIKKREICQPPPSKYDYYKPLRSLKRI